MVELFRDDARSTCSRSPRIPYGTLVEPFAWRRGGTGTMRVTLDGGRIARLVVAFD